MAPLGFRKRERERHERRKRKIGLKWRKKPAPKFYREWTGPVHLNQSGSLPKPLSLTSSPFDLLPNDVYAPDLVFTCALPSLSCATHSQPLDLGFEKELGWSEGYKAVGSPRSNSNPWTWACVCSTSFFPLFLLFPPLFFDFCTSWHA